MTRVKSRRFTKAGKREKGSLILKNLSKWPRIHGNRNDLQRPGQPGGMERANYKFLSAKKGLRGGGNPSERKRTIT